MRPSFEALGIDPKTRFHRKMPLTRWEGGFLGVLWVEHAGRENCLSADGLARRLAARLGSAINDRADMEEWKRDVRALQNHLLCEHNVPVYSAAGRGGGYWIGENRAEGNAFYETFRKRGLTGMVKASRGKKSAMVDMITQISFQFEELVDKAGLKTAPEERDSLAPIEIVDVFLQKMTANPAQFADGLKKIGEKYGSVLVPRDRYNAIVGALRTQTQQMAELVRSLEN